VTDAAAQVVAVQQGLGVTTLPCFVGDADPTLVRVPGTEMHLYGTIWLLTQGETRKTKRVRLFTEFISQRLNAHAGLMAGKVGTQSKKKRPSHGGWRGPGMIPGVRSMEVAIGRLTEEPVMG